MLFRRFAQERAFFRNLLSPCYSFTAANFPLGLYFASSLSKIDIYFPKRL